MFFSEQQLFIAQRLLIEHGSAPSRYPLRLSRLGEKPNIIYIHPVGAGWVIEYPDRESEHFTNSGAALFAAHKSCLEHGYTFLLDTPPEGFANPS